MIEWLQNFSGLKSIGPNMERIELENLRKEMTKYKKKYPEYDDIEEHSDSDVNKFFIIYRVTKIKKNKTK